MSVPSVEEKQDAIKHLFVLIKLKYEPDTGEFYWRFGGRKGCRADYRNDRYMVVRLNGNRYPAHRLAWFYIYGEWPTKELDHINRDKLDNRIDNLREATRRQNSHNKEGLNGTSKYKGVYYNKKLGKWVAQIRKGCWTKHLGVFDDEKMAGRAYDLEAKKRHGQYFYRNT